MASRRYRVLLPLLVHTPDASYGQGEEFEHELTEEEETESLASGLLEIVPCEYRVIAEDSIVHDTPTGETFVAALPLGNEALLLEGGHIERVEPPAVKKSKKKKEAKG